jgi:predicted small lipoprotein YifL
MRHAANLALAALLALGVAGCGLRDPVNQPDTTSTQARTATVSPPVTAPRSTLAPVQTGEGSPGSAQRTLYEFALTYGNFTSGGMTARAHALEHLATEQLARTIARESEARGHPAPIPKGASISSDIVNLDLSPAHASHRQAVVVLEERLTPPSGITEQPITDLFVAEVVLTRAGWQVSHFTPQQ